jgi:hypothetical protein
MPLETSAGGGVDPGQIQVGNADVALVRGHQLRAQVGGDPPARDDLVEAAHRDHRGGRRRPVRLDLQVVVTHDERTPR